MGWNTEPTLSCRLECVRIAHARAVGARCPGLRRLASSFEGRRRIRWHVAVAGRVRYAGRRRVRNSSRTWSSAARVGWPGSSMRCSVRTEWGFIGASGLALLSVELDGDEGVAQSVAQELEALSRREAVAPEPQAEHLQPLRRAPSRDHVEVRFVAQMVNSRLTHAGTNDDSPYRNAPSLPAASGSLPGTPNRCGITAVQPMSTTRRAKLATFGVVPGSSAITTTAGPAPARYTVRVLPPWVNSFAWNSARLSSATAGSQPERSRSRKIGGSPQVVTSRISAPSDVGWHGMLVPTSATSQCRAGRGMEPTWARAEDWDLARIEALPPAESAPAPRAPAVTQGAISTQPG